MIDRRDDDIVRSGLYSEALVRALQSDRRVVCVLNRTGRAQMLGCLKCGTLAACEREAAVRQDDEGVLRCPRCELERPTICDHCAATVFRPIRIGVTKAREQLETSLREPVDEIAGAKATSTATGRRARVVVGTEAALQQVAAADVVAFLEFDQELGAPRYRAVEQAMTLLARASASCGREGSVLVQARQPDHEVLRAATIGDTERSLELGGRAPARLLQLPPFATVAAIGGEAAPAFVEVLSPRLADVRNAARPARRGPVDGASRRPSGPARRPQR